MCARRSRRWSYTDVVWRSRVRRPARAVNGTSDGRTSSADRGDRSGWVPPMPPTHSSPHSPADQRPARPRRPLAVVAVLVAAACALGACDFVPYSGASGSKVFYTGDSLPTMSAAQLDGAILGRGYPVQAKPSPRTTHGGARPEERRE